MRGAVLVAVVLVACGKNEPAPDPAAFRAMTPEQQCEATAVRGARCADELMLDDLRQLAGSDRELQRLGDRLELEQALKPSRPSERRALHMTRCHGDSGYAAAVVQCWDVVRCNEFVECVRKASVEALRRHAAQPVGGAGGGSDAQDMQDDPGDDQ